MSGINNVWLPLAANSAEEAMHSTIHSSKSLMNAAVLTPGGAPLSDTALDTLRHMRYYTNAGGGVVLYSDRTGVMVDPADIADMLREASDCACEVVGRMPDFTPYNMDDGGGILLMQENAFCYRPYGLGASLGMAMEARQECLDACENPTPIAIMYSNAADMK